MEQAKLDTDSRVSVSPEALFVDVEGETVLMSVSSGVYGGLDAIGTAIWQKLAEPIQIAALSQQLAEQYQAPYAQVEADVLRFLDDLFAHDMITLHI